MVPECIDKISPYLDYYIDSVGCDPWLPQNYTYEFPRVKDTERILTINLIPTSMLGIIYQQKGLLLFLFI